MPGLDDRSPNRLGADHVEVTGIVIEQRVSIVGRAGSVLADLRSDIERRDIGVATGKRFEMGVYLGVAVVGHDGVR
ncbi:hypothetical protein D3C71_2138470 [compost metagenome]